MRRQRAAFSLVELLIVVAIVAVLVALLLPVIAKARAAAKAVHCKSNLQQIGYAVRMYLEGNRHRYPDEKVLGGYCNYRRLPGDVDPNVPGSLPETYGWPALLDAGGYLSAKGDRRVWLCPAADEWFWQFGNTYAWGNGFGDSTRTLSLIIKSDANRPPGTTPAALIWDNYLSKWPGPPGVPVPPGRIPPGFNALNYYAPHRYGGKQAGPASLPYDGSAVPPWGDDRGCANMLWADLHVGAVRVRGMDPASIGRVGWEFIE